MVAERLEDRAVVGPRDHLDLGPVTAQLVLQLVGRAPCDGATMVDHEDPVGEAVGLLQVLGGEEGRHPLVDQLVDQVPHRQAAAGVEAGGGLVEEQDHRAGDEAHRDVEPASHAAREARHHPVGGVAQLEALEQLARPGAGLAVRHPEEAPDQLEVLGGGEPLVHRRVLAREADARADASGVGVDVDAVDRGAAAVCSEERGEDPDGRRLAGAVRPEDAEHRTALDRQVERVEGQGLSEPLAESFCVDDRHRVAAPRRRGR